MSDDMANPQYINMFYYLYLLLLNNGQIYTGSTGDLKRRLAEHMAGRVKFTRQRLPAKLIHYEAYKNKIDAQRRERYLKTTQGKKFLKQQIKELLIQLNKI